MVDGADRARVLGFVRRAARRRVQRLSRASRGDRRSGSTAATARFAHLQRARRPGRDLTAVVITHGHPDHCVDLYGLHVLLPLRARARRAPGVRARGRREATCATSSATGATRSTGTRSATATRASVGGSRPALLAHRPPAADRSRSRSRTTASGSCTRPTPDRSGASSAFAPGADLVLSEATYLHDDINGADPPLGAPGRARWPARAQARRLMLTHLWPTLDPDVSVAEGSEAFGDAGHARGAEPRRSHV